MKRFLAAYILFLMVVSAASVASLVPRSLLAAAPAGETIRLAQASDVSDGLGKVKGPFSGLTTFDTSNPYKFAAGIIKVMLQVGFMVAVVFVVVGGYFFITARGNQEQSARGRRTIIYALIGIAVMIMAYVLVSFGVNLISNNI